ncbi:uncharacterized protein LOC123676008 [Harmonia axyridis]|uniref:uncharacterized protein LOC123676008 n=1 Tax=Harmonia axyridis TaxID=115357 RepID=UPI001E278CBB|nr:uncharacterized protein LOC123676008 [Harmonia axyridis]
MNLKLSRRDIQFFGNVCFHHGLLGFMPCFLFRDGSIVEVPKMRYFSNFAIAIFLATQIFSIYPIYKYNFPHFVGSQMLVSFAFILTNIIFYVLCFTNSTINQRRRWKRIMHLFLKTDVILGNRNEMDWNIFKNPNLQFIVWHIIFIFTIFLRISNYRNMNLQLVISHIMNFMGFYYQCFFSIFTSNLCLAIKCRFSDGRALLTREYQQIHCSDDSKYRIKKIVKNVKGVFEATDELIRILSDVLGWQILVIFFRSVVAILGFVDGLVTNTLKSSNRSTMISVCMLIGKAVFNFSIIIYSCHSATREAEKLYYSSKNLEKKFHPHSCEARELKFLSMQLEYRSVFSAAGFINIDSKTLLSIISIVSTYLIVIIQLNNGVLQSPIQGT